MGFKSLRRYHPSDEFPPEFRPKSEGHKSHNHCGL